MAELIPDPKEKGEAETSDVVDISKELEDSGIVGFVQGRFKRAEEGKQDDESRCLQAYKNYRGIYDSNSKFRENERSRVFVKITKTKVLAAYGKIIEILFSSKRFPIEVKATEVPEGIAEYAHLEQQPGPEQVNPYGFEGDGQELLPGATEIGDKHFLGGLEAEYGQSDKLKAGPGRMGEPQIKPADIAARNMDKAIQDQLTEGHTVNIIKHVVFESVLLGTGIAKGPFNFTKVSPNWDGVGEDRKYAPKNSVVPRMSAVSFWDFYPDPSAITMEDAAYTVQRHKLHREQIREFIDRPHFNKDAIERCLAQGPNYEKRGYESQLYAENNINNFEDRYEVLEYWGNMDRKLAEEAGIDISKNVTESDSVQVNIWVCGTEVLRGIANPFTPARIPYLVVPYEINPYQFFGIGVPENMEDAQVIMNGHMRMAIDNLAFAGNLVFDIDETMLVPGQSLKVFPGKIFRRQSGQAGQAVHGVKFPNTAPENIQMYETARRLADEETGIPSIMHGQTGVTGTGRTASGLSMLMSGAATSIKTVIKNIDDFLLKPMGEAYFRWNMQFNAERHPKIEGDLDVKARGTSSVMQHEVRTQRLTNLLQVATNPMLAPFFKIPNLIKEIAIAQEIEPESMVNDVNEAAIFADILRGLNAAQLGPEGAPPGQQQEVLGNSGGVPPGGGATDPSGVGGGNVGTGNVPSPGESNFTG